METIKRGRIILSPQFLNKVIFRIVILYLLALIIILSYIPFDIQSAAFEKDGHFTLSPAVIEYAWLNPPQEEAGKMIAGVDWNRINLELIGVTIFAGIACLFSKK